MKFVGVCLCCGVVRGIVGVVHFILERLLFMLDGRFVEFAEHSYSEGETFVTFVEVTDANRGVLERFINLGARADFVYDELEIREADSRVNADTVDVLSMYDTNGYMPGFVISELDDEVVSQLDEFEAIDDSEALGDALAEAFYQRSGFVSRV